VATNDGYIVPIAFGGVDWDATVEFLESEELAHERFSTAEGRMENAADLDRILRAAFAQYGKEDLFYRANRRRGLIYGIVQDAAELHENPQFKHREYFAEVDHPVAGKANYPGAPFGMSKTPWSVNGPAPTLGQHNIEVYVDQLGLSKEELGQLVAAGVT
jgi:crotonobetainyl-CoA:carnitine CoA-transferase CaiB-like acyl-CoA transferase